MALEMFMADLWSLTNGLTSGLTSGMTSGMTIGETDHGGMTLQAAAGGSSLRLGLNFN